MAYFQEKEVRGSANYIKIFLEAFKHDDIDLRARKYLKLLRVSYTVTPLSKLTYLLTLIRLWYLLCPQVKLIKHFATNLLS